MTRRLLLPGQHAIITGGSSGLGAALAEELLARGLRVTLVARGEAQLRAAAGVLEAGGSGRSVAIAPLDVTDESAVRAWFESLPEQDAPDVLVNCAGILREGYFTELPLDDFQDVLRVNVMGVVTMTQAALPVLRARGGSVVNIASVAGLMGVFGYTPYCAAKHALVGFTESLRFELEPQGVSVHLVCPGEFDSPMVDALDQSRTPENRAHTLAIPKRPVEAVARDTVRALARGKRTIIPGRLTQATVVGARLFPGISAAVSRRRIAGASQQA